MNAKAALRAATLGRQKSFVRKLVKITAPDGTELEVEVRAPSVRSRGLIIRRAKAMGGDVDKLEPEHFQVEAVLQLCFVPGTDEHIFEEADREELLAQPAGGFVDKLAEVALPLLNVAEAEKKELEKNSEGTPSA
ncbi:MAG: hypothetical protein AMXMBFR56_72530 [Polyangiaceae bacterium]